MIAAACKGVGGYHISVHIDVPFTPSALIDAVREAITRSNHNIKLAVFDHITSVTACLLPVQQLIELCHSLHASREKRMAKEGEGKKGDGDDGEHKILGPEEWIPVLIDGAHALGAVDLNLTQLNPDFYVSNCHKWFLCPKGKSPIQQYNIH